MSDAAQLGHIFTLGIWCCIKYMSGAAQLGRVGDEGGKRLLELATAIRVCSDMIGFVTILGGAGCREPGAAGGSVVSAVHALLLTDGLLSAHEVCSTTHKAWGTLGT